MSTKSFISYCSANFNFSVQGTTDNNILSETTTVMKTFTTSQVTDTSTTSSVNGTTTADSKIDIYPLANETDGSNLVTTAAGIIITARTSKINTHGLQVGSFQFYMVVAATISMIVVVLTTIVIFVIYMIYHVRNKTSKLSLTVNRRPREGQRSNNPNLQEALLLDISILPDFFVYNNVIYIHARTQNSIIQMCTLYKTIKTRYRNS